MLLTLFVIALLTIVGVWAFPDRRTSAVAAGGVLVLALSIPGNAPTLRAVLDRNAYKAPDATNTGIDPQAGNGFGVDESFMRWVTTKVPPRAHYLLRCPTPVCPVGAQEWQVSRLAPRTPVTDPADADWIVSSGAPLPDKPSGAAIVYDANRNLRVVRLHRSR